jgi:hypothetical protein
MSTFPQITSPPQASAEVLVNRMGETLEHQAVYGLKQSTTTALTWGYYGGRWGGFAITADVLTLTDDSANYVVVAIATGVISVATASTNWDNDTDYVRVYKVTAAGGVVTAVEDHRAGPGGVHGGAGGGGGGGTAGRHAVYVAAAAMYPSVSGGCAAMNWIASAANQPDIATLSFDASTAEYAQFSLAMPKSWDEGTVTFKPIWSHAATTTNFGVVWQLQGVAVSNDDQIPVAYGTAQSSTDTGGTTDDLYVGPESSAITIAGTPAAEDIVFFRVSRLPTDGSDTMAIDARLHGLILYITTDADTDA